MTEPPQDYIWRICTSMNNRQFSFVPKGLKVSLRRRHEAPCVKCDLTWTKQKGLHLLDAWVAANVLKVPAEEALVHQRLAGVQGADVSSVQRRVPHIQVGDVPIKRLGEIPPERVLILPQNEYPVPGKVAGRVCAGARVPPVPVHVDGPAAAATVPGDADVMPRPIVREGGLVGQVLPVDDQSQEDASLDVQLAPELEFIGKDTSSVREDGGHLRPVWLPLDTETDADGRQVREGHVEASKGLMGIDGEG